MNHIQKILYNLKLKFGSDNIKDVWFDITKYPRRLYRFFVKMIQYSKVLWRDEDYDYYFILLLLKYKLQRTREHIVSHDFVESAPKIGEEIKHAEVLIDRILEDDYCKDLCEAHDKKWGEIIQYFDPKEDDEKYYTFHIVRKNATTQELEEQARNEQLLIYEEQHKAREADLDELFKHIRANIQGWWD